MQEVSGTIERTKEQLSEIQQQVSTLEDTQPVYVKIRVFTSRVPLAPLEEAPSTASPPDITNITDITAEPTGAAGDEACAAEEATHEAGLSQAANQPNGISSNSKAQEDGVEKAGEESGDGNEGAESPEGEKEEAEVEYEVIETPTVQFTVDRYTEKMGTEVKALQAQVDDLAQRRDAVLEAFKEMVAHFGERPQAVKESEWWGDFLKFLKPFNKIQTAILKARAAEQEAAERKRKKEQSGGTTHRQRGSF